MVVERTIAPRPRHRDRFGGTALGREYIRSIVPGELRQHVVSN
jgi:hypothetical protein